jgi:hypothetical protein
MAQADLEITSSIGGGSIDGGISGRWLRCNLCNGFVVDRLPSGKIGGVRGRGLLRERIIQLDLLYAQLLRQIGHLLDKFGVRKPSNIAFRAVLRAASSATCEDLKKEAPRKAASWSRKPMALGDLRSSASCARPEYCGGFLEL